MSRINVTDIVLSGKVDHFKGTDVASVTSPDIMNATGNFVHITGTTTITGFAAATQAGVRRTVVFDGVLTLTHGANLVLPGAANITTAAGDIAEFVADTTSKWICTSYFKASVASFIGGNYIGRQILTASGTYTPTAGTKMALVKQWGGGGAGGSTSAVAGSAGGGGGSGAYCETLISNVTGTYTFTIGAGGTAASGAAGGAGGDTTFVNGATTITAPGGSGGAFLAGTAAIKVTAGGNGGTTPTNANLGRVGAPGSFGITSTVVTVAAAGNGGASSLGANGNGGVITSAATSNGISAGANSGSGGGGAATGAAVAGVGGNGGSGVIIIEEYR